jgi:hypothetical protein
MPFTNSRFDARITEMIFRAPRANMRSIPSPAARAPSPKKLGFSTTWIDQTPSQAGSNITAPPSSASRHTPNVRHSVCLIWCST